MTNAELLAKIKAEIEKQRKFIEGMFIEGDNNFYDGQDDAYNNVLTFLSTLESEKPVPNDLEEAADNHIREVLDAAGHPGWDWETRDIKDAFIAGANWQKSQMLKEAVEGEVYLYHSYNRDATAILVDVPKDKLGDKVRIIICKKED